MVRTASRHPLRHLRASDMQGLAQLAAQGTQGAARIAEGAHQAVLAAMGLAGGEAPGSARGITGLVYRVIDVVARLAGQGADVALATLQPLLESSEEAEPGTPEREAVLAVLNGVMGDHLAASHNPLATPMTLRHQGVALDWQALPALPAATGKVLLAIHGLCMNDLQWHTQKDGQVVDHGEALASALGATPLHLRYNSGLHTSTNGRELSGLLEQLVARWPAPIEEITVLAHSMGGLLIRSAVQGARQDGLRWPGHLKRIVFLGTPHHGAPLERAGNLLDGILGSTPFTAPFAKLGKLRSAGITDLRYGYVLDADWQGRDRFEPNPDRREPLPLPAGVACYAVAATTAARASPLAERLVGDGLVPLASALGRHEDPQRSLGFAKASQWIAYRMNHLELLSSPDVTGKILQWLRPAHASKEAP